MSIEKYAVHVAPRGGKIDMVVSTMEGERKVALDARWAYARAKGAIGLYQNESHVDGLIFKEIALLPNGWAKTLSTEAGVVASPKSKDRTKESRALTRFLKAELAGLPRLPGAWDFTTRIGGNQTLVGGDGGRFQLLNCWYERVDQTTFVMTPWHTEQDVKGENVEAKAPTEKTRIAFTPEGCERVPLSFYYATKEAAPAERHVA